MRAFHLGIAVLAFVPSLAVANPTVDLGTVSCLGLQSSSFADVVSLTCTGDFSLSGGNIAADSKIVLSSGGALSLDNLSITAPQVEFFAGSSVSLNDGVSIVANSIFVLGSSDGPIPTVSVSPGVSISSGNGADAPPINVGTGSISGGDTSLPGGGPILILSSAPEPTSLAMLMAGLLALGGFLGTRGKHSA